MTRAQNENRLRKVVADHRFEDLTQKDAPARLTKIIGTLAETVSEIREIMDAPPATGLAATAVTGAVLLSWSDVPRATIPSIDGTRIWRAKASEDANQNFGSNNKKSVIVSLIRSTNWADHPSDTTNYIYWIEHLNKDGRNGSPSAGILKAAL